MFIHTEFMISSLYSEGRYIHTDWPLGQMSIVITEVQGRHTHAGIVRKEGESGL